MAELTDTPFQVNRSVKVKVCPTAQPDNKRWNRKIEPIIIKEQDESKNRDRRRRKRKREPANENVDEEIAGSSNVAKQKTPEVESVQDQKTSKEDANRQETELDEEERERLEFETAVRELDERDARVNVNRYQECGIFQDISLPFGDNWSIENWLKRKVNDIHLGEKRRRRKKYVGEVGQKPSSEGGDVSIRTQEKLITHSDRSIGGECTLCSTKKDLNKGGIQSETTTSEGSIGGESRPSATEKDLEKDVKDSETEKPLKKEETKSDEKQAERSVVVAVGKDAGIKTEEILTTPPEEPIGGESSSTLTEKDMRIKTEGKIASVESSGGQGPSTKVPEELKRRRKPGKKKGGKLVEVVAKDAGKKSEEKLTMASKESIGETGPSTKQEDQESTNGEAQNVSISYLRDCTDLDKSLNSHKEKKGVAWEIAKNDMGMIEEAVTKENYQKEEKHETESSTKNIKVDNSIVSVSIKSKEKRAEDNWVILNVDVVENDEFSLTTPVGSSPAGSPTTSDCSSTTPVSSPTGEYEMVEIGQDPAEN